MHLSILFSLAFIMPSLVILGQGMDFLSFSKSCNLIKLLLLFFVVGSLGGFWFPGKSYAPSVIPFFDL